jgi:uncharacterized SAM-binding protein YcdF (DUF218 family)
VSFKEVAIALLVPPIPLMYVAMIGLLVQGRHQRIGRFLAWFGLLGLLFLAMPAVSGFLLAALERDLPLTPSPDRPPQAIVILGGDTLGGTSQAPIVRLGPLSLERVRFGASLARRTGLPILVTGGRLEAYEPPVAVIMADNLVHDFQVPVQWIERGSRDTWENAHLSAIILREQGIKSVYLVTQAWHMRRAIVAFADTGITVTAAPPGLDRTGAPRAGDFVPEAGAWRTSYFAMHEWIGWIWYSLRQTG